MGDVIWAQTSRLLDGDALRPKHRVENVGPVFRLAIGSLEERFSDVVVPALDWALRARVVGGYADVVDVVALDKEVDSGDVLWRVVGHDFLDRAVPAQDTFPQEAGDGVGGLGTQFLAFRVRAEQAASVDGIAVAAGRWHEETCQCTICGTMA